MAQEDDIAKMKREKIDEYSSKLENFWSLIDKNMGRALNRDGNLDFLKEDYAELQEVLTEMKQKLLEYEAEFPNGLGEPSSSDEEEEWSGDEGEEEKQSWDLR